MEANMDTVNSNSPMLTYYNVIFSQLRGMVEHEDDLIDRRLKWAIGASALFFTVIGGSSLAASQNNWKIQIDELSLITILFSSMGVVICHFSSISIHAAQLAIKNLNQEYVSIIKSIDNVLIENCIHTWRLAGNELTQYSGFQSEIYTTYTLTWGWINIFIYAVYKILSSELSILNNTETKIPLAFICLLSTFIYLYISLSRKNAALATGRNTHVGGHPGDRINKEIIRQRTNPG